MNVWAANNGYWQFYNSAENEISSGQKPKLRIQRPRDGFMEWNTGMLDTERGPWDCQYYSRH